MEKLENSYNCNRKKVKNEILEDNQKRNEEHENEKNENKQDEKKQNENEQTEIKNITNSNKNNIIYPIGLKNFLYKKSKDYYFYKSYEMTTGNICYMNSSIQCLFHLKDFTDKIIETASYQKDELITATSNLIDEMKNKNSKVLSVKNIKKVMGDKIDERYKENNQEDANEFISNFLDGLLNEIGDKNNLPKPLDIENESDRAAYDKFYNRFYKIKGNSFLLDLFYSIIKTQKKCESCSKVNSIKFNTNNIIELPIKSSLAKGGKEINLNDIIANYLNTNKNITGECKFCRGNIYEKINI